jgi:hypothetical protein
MIEYMKLGGSPVRVSSIQQRAIGKPDGAVAREWKIVIVVRGIAAHRQVADLLKRQPLAIAFPNDEGWEGEILVEIASASHTEGGAKGAESFRHLLTLREIDRTTADRLTREAEAAEPANLAIRLEALIDALVAANLLDRAAVETAEQRIRERQVR